MTFVLISAGLISAVGAIIHTFATPLFGWARDLESLTEDNRRTALAMNAMVTYILVLIAVADFSLALGLFPEPITVLIFIAIAGFWATRTIVQLIYYSLKKAVNWVFLTAYVFMTAAHVVAI